MNMQSGEYWARRFAALEKTQIKSDAELAKELDKLYRQAQREIESKISRWYMKFAQNNEISMADAKKLLKQGDLEEFKWSVDEYIQHGENNLDDAFTKQLVNASSKVHISRYESLLTELQATAVSLMGKQETKLTEHLKDAYSKSYRHTAYEIQKGTGIGFRLGGIDEKSLETVLKKPWAADGSNFSDRIWKDKQSLLSELDTQLKRNILLGKGPDEAAAAIAKRFETSKANAYRLIQTESAAISSKAHEDCFHNLNVEEFEIVETLDGHTCPICGAMDGKHFPMTDYAIGVTVPPFHPNCRGTTVPYYADLDGYGERFARNLDGDVFYVPADTTYEQWEKMQDEKYGAGSVDKTRKMHYNKNADKKLFEEYKAILKENLTDSFSEYQRIKYNDENQWEYLKGLAEYLRKYPTSDKRYYDIQLKLKSIGINKGVVLPPQQKQAYILPSGKHDPYHIMHRMIERSITDDNLREYIKDAKIMFVQWGGKRQLFVSDKGMCVITNENNNWIFKTAWNKHDYDKESDIILEMIRNAGL